MHVCNPSPWEIKTRSWLDSEFEANLDYMRSIYLPTPHKNNYCLYSILIIHFIGFINWNKCEIVGSRELSQKRSGHLSQQHKADRKLVQKTPSRAVKWHL